MYKRYLSPKELSERWEGIVSVKTLAHWRSRGKGPRFSRFGNKIRYPLPEVEQWELENIYGSTREYGRVVN